MNRVKRRINVFEPENHLDNSQKKWFAIYTKYKAEKYVHARLLKKGISSFLPLVKSTKRYVRKIRHYEKPLINCYVFVCIDRSEYNKVLETEYVLKFLKQGNNLISIPDHEIELLGRIVDFENVKAARPLNFDYGKEVEIIRGQLTGLVGKLVSRKNKNEFVVELTNIGIQLQIDINPAYLKPVGVEMAV